MKLNSEINRETIEYFYKEYKALIFPVIAIIISILLIIFFLLPQITAFPGKKAEVDSKNLKLKKLNEVSAILQSVNSQTVESNLTLTGQALPVDKNFELVIRAISQSAGKSGVVISGYGFKSTGALDQTTAQRFLRLEFSLEVEGDLDQTIAFVREMNRSLPISEVSGIKYSQGRTSMIVSFFYKPLDASGVSDRTQIRVLSEREQLAFDEVSGWDDSSDTPVEITETDSTPSAELESDSSPSRAF